MQIERINILFSQGRFEMAYKEVKELLSQEPQNDQAICSLASVCIVLGKLEEGEQVAKDGLMRQPWNSYYFYLLSNLEIKRNRIQEALKYINQAIALDSQMANYFDLKARIYLYQQNYSEAEIAARQALELDSEDTDALNTLSKSLVGQGRGKEAATVIDKALQTDPENWETHANYGFRNLEIGKTTKAIEHFRQALINDPTQAHAQHGMKLAMKARFPLYRWLLQFQLYMSKKGRNTNFIVMIGIVVLINLASRVGESMGGVGLIVMYTIVALLLAFTLSTWILDPIMTFVLYTRKNGRLSLDEGELNTAKFVQWNLIAGFVGVGSALLLSELAWLNMVGIGFLGLVMSTNMWESQDKRVRNTAKVFFVLATLLFSVGLVSKIAFGIDGTMFSYAGIICGVVYSWVGNSLFRS